MRGERDRQSEELQRLHAKLVEMEEIMMVSQVVSKELVDAKSKAVSAGCRFLFFLFFFCRERTTVSPRAMDGNHTMRRRACEQRERARERERDREEERVAETA